MPLPAAIGAYVRDSWQPFPVLKPPHENVGVLLVQPAGSALRLLVSCRSVAGRPSSVVKVTETAWVPVGATALICPVGDGVATALSLVVAAYSTFNEPVSAAPAASV